MNTFHLRLVASNRVFFNDRCQMVVFETTDGQIGFQAHHLPAITAVKNGELRIQKADGTWLSCVVSDGIAENANNRMKIVVFSCETAEEIDVARAREAEERAKEEMRQKQSIVEYEMSKQALARAMARLKEANRNTRN